MRVDAATLARGGPTFMQQGSQAGVGIKTDDGGRYMLVFFYIMHVFRVCDTTN
jgi:hypothetical protein